MREEQKYRQALLLAAQLMIKHGLGDWKVELHSKRRVLADCNNLRKTIRYSKHFLQVTEKDQFERVTLHEVAHALVGAGHGHDNVFKRKCREITPGEAYDGTSVPKSLNIYKYKLECPNCGVSGGSNKLRIFPPLCAKCSVGGLMRPLRVTENQLILKSW